MIWMKIDVQNLALRPCGDDDRSFCYAVKKAALRCYVEPIWGWEEEVQVAFHRKDWEARRPEIIMLDGEDVGTIEVVRSAAGLHLGEFYLFPAYQRKGIGSYFMRSLVEEADRDGLPVTLEVIKINPVRSLYERFGFKITVETKTHYVMVRQASKVMDRED